MRVSIFYFILVIGICSCKQNNPEQVDNPLYKQSVEQRVSLPNGWSLTPQGKALPLGDLPLNSGFFPKRHLCSCYQQWAKCSFPHAL